MRDKDTLFCTYFRSEDGNTLVVNASFLTFQVTIKSIFPKMSSGQTLGGFDSNNMFYVASTGKVFYNNNDLTDASFKAVTFATKQAIIYSTNQTDSCYKYRTDLNVIDDQYLVQYGLISIEQTVNLFKKVPALTENLVVPVGTNLLKTNVTLTQ